MTMTAKTVTMLVALALATPGTAAAAPKPAVAVKAAPAKPPPAKPAAKPAPKPAAKPAPKPASANPPAPLPDTPEIAALRRAYEFAVPIYEMMRARHLQVSKAEGFGLPGPNRLYARTVLADATSRDVTTPNNDTLYSSAWLDLAAGPVILDMPAIPGRYHSAALIDLFTDNVAIVGSRGGGKGGRYLIAGPGWAGTPPAGTVVLRSPTNDAWLLVRVLVNGPDDLAAATGLIRGFTLEVPKDLKAAEPVVVVPTPVPDAKIFLSVVAEAIARNPLPPAVAARATFPELGLADGWVDPASVSPATLALWDKSLPALRAEIKGGFLSVGEVVDGWNYPGPGIGDFGADDAGRARVALGGLGALPRTEAVYLSATKDKDGAPLTGAKAYTVHLPAKLPVGAFWSLTMYEQEPDGRLFFIDTPSKRFAVGDRTPELRPERDGGYDIFVQASAPSGERVVNWLPAPKGPFRLVFRAYLPKPALLDGSFRLPPVEVTELIP